MRPTPSSRKSRRAAARRTAARGSPSSTAARRSCARRSGRSSTASPRTASTSRGRRSKWRRSRTTTWAASAWTPTCAPACRISSPPAKRSAAPTAPTAFRATRSPRPSPSAGARACVPLRWQRRPQCRRSTQAAKTGGPIGIQDQCRRGDRASCSELMNEHVGPLRTPRDCERALEHITGLDWSVDVPAPRAGARSGMARPATTCATCVSSPSASPRAALAREESRGAHQRAGFSRDERALAAAPAIRLACDGVRLAS